MKPELGGSSRKSGFNPAIWFFTLPGHKWPPTADAIAQARAADEAFDGATSGCGVDSGTGPPNDETLVDDAYVRDVLEAAAKTAQHSKCMDACEPF